MVRAALGGVCVGGGVAVGAYSGGWFLLLAAVFATLGTGIIFSDYLRSVFVVAAAGDPVQVEVDLIDRTNTLAGTTHTLVAGTAYPEGDAPFRFQTGANPSDVELAGVIRNGRGTLPDQAVGTPGVTPVTEHRAIRMRASSALVAATAMWATILLPPSGFWDWHVAPSGPLAAVSAPVTADERPLWQWYDDAIAHIRADDPDTLDSMLSIVANETYVLATVYLGGDRSRVYEGRTRGWEVREQTTTLRSRDTFGIGDVQQLSAREVLRQAASQLPEAKRQPNRLEVSRETEAIFGDPHPLLVESWFGDGSDIRMYARADGTIAPWWHAEDLAAALQRVEATLADRDIPADAPSMRTLTIEPNSSNISFDLEYTAGGISHSTRVAAGKFATQDSSSSSSSTIPPGFRLADLSPEILTRVRDDAMARSHVDPVDRATAKITIAPWRRIDSDHREETIVIEVDYTDAHGNSAVYALDGQPLSA